MYKLTVVNNMGDVLMELTTGCCKSTKKEGPGGGVESVRLGLMGKAESQIVQTEEPVQNFFICWIEGWQAMRG